MPAHAASQAIGEICDLFSPQECRIYFAAAGYWFISKSALPVVILWFESMSFGAEPDGGAIPYRRGDAAYLGQLSSSIR
jgi:hypothetical protein